jgi:hypothetical protein
MYIILQAVSSYSALNNMLRSYVAKQVVIQQRVNHRTLLHVNWEKLLVDRQVHSIFNKTSNQMHNQSYIYCFVA